LVHRTQDAESDEFLLLQQLSRLCVYVDFEWFLPLTEKLNVWQSATAFGGQKLQKAETNRG
jgi:hypothetical protein